MILGSKRQRASFKDQVTEFWQWYASVADRFYQTIEENECSSLVDEVSEFMDRVLPSMSWVFGSGEGGGHSFTLSGEGQIHKQMLAQYWLDRAPQMTNWTFYGSRQPSPPGELSKFAIQVGDNDSVDVENFLIRTSVDDDARKVDICAWHPSLHAVPEDHHLQILFLLLDEALGEFGTEMWLGEVDIEPFEPNEHTRPLNQLPEFISQVNEYHKWEKLSPLESYSLYEIPEPQTGPRGDTVVGTTVIPDVLFDFLQNGRLSDDPFEGLGAEFVYVAIDGAVFPDGSQSEVRGNIEDALEDALHSEAAGRALGGAFGENQSYVDLLLLDGANSHAIIERTLEQLQLNGRSQVMPFVA